MEYRYKFNIPRTYFSKAEPLSARTHKIHSRTYEILTMKTNARPKYVTGLSVTLLPNHTLCAVVLLSYIVME